MLRIHEYNSVRKMAPVCWYFHIAMAMDNRLQTLMEELQWKLKGSKTIATDQHCHGSLTVKGHQIVTSKQRAFHRAPFDEVTLCGSGFKEAGLRALALSMLSLPTPPPEPS